MNARKTALRVMTASVLSALCLVAAVGAQAPSGDKMTRMELVSLTGKVTALDQAARTVTLRGPLGGALTGKVSDDVKNLAQVKVGDLVTISYYQSLAVSAKRKGQTTTIFESASGNSAEEGQLPGGYVAKKSTELVTVVSVDAEKNSIVVQDEKGAITAVAVVRPEIAAKLVDIKDGDQLEVTRTEAYIVAVSRAETGAKPSVSYTASTLVVDHGEIIRRLNNTIWVRNEAGRVVKVVVDPDFTFKLDGEDATVVDLKPGMKLKRTAFRVIEDVSYEAE